MSTFKVGDKVRRTGSNCAGTVTGGIYTVKGIRLPYTIMLLEFPEDELGWSTREFELVQGDAVLTPEEVFKHLQLCTELQFAVGSQWYDHSGDTGSIKVSELVSSKWRIKPVPEIIEANGRKYKLIEE